MALPGVPTDIVLGVIETHKPQQNDNMVTPFGASLCDLCARDMMMMMTKCGSGKYQILSTPRKDIVSITLKEYLLTIFYLNAESEYGGKRRKQNTSTVIYSTRCQKLTVLIYVLLQVLKGIREVRAIKGKMGSLEWSIFAGEGPHVPMGLKLFTKVGTSQRANYFLWLVNQKRSVCSSQA